MPYIPQHEAEALAKNGEPMTKAGHLNCAITTFCLKYLEDQGGTTYSKINDVLGALEGAKLEFVRRVVNPYEAKKSAQPGRVDPYKVIGWEYGKEHLEGQVFLDQLTSDMFI